MNFCPPCAAKVAAARVGDKVDFCPPCTLIVDGAVTPAVSVTGQSMKPTGRVIGGSIEFAAIVPAEVSEPPPDSVPLDQTITCTKCGHVGKAYVRSSAALELFAEDVFRAGAEAQMRRVAKELRSIGAEGEFPAVDELAAMIERSAPPDWSKEKVRRRTATERALAMEALLRKVADPATMWDLDGRHVLERGHPLHDDLLALIGEIDAARSTGG